MESKTLKNRIPTSTWLPIINFTLLVFLVILLLSQHYEIKNLEKNKSELENKLTSLESELEKIEKNIRNDLYDMENRLNIRLTAIQGSIIIWSD